MKINFRFLLLAFLISVEAMLSADRALLIYGSLAEDESPPVEEAVVHKQPEVVDEPLISEPVLVEEYFLEYQAPVASDTLFHARIEWLYWNVKEDNLRAGSFIDDFPNPELKIANATIIQPGDQFCHGFRVHIGSEFPCEQWELNTSYAYLPLCSHSDFKETIPLEMQTEEHKQFIIPNVDGFPSFQAFSSEGGLTAFTSMLTKWGGNFSYADLDLARKLTFNNNFSLKPHFGIRVAWSDQHLFMRGGLQQPSVNNSTFGSLKYKQKFNGYGIEGGIWANWELGCGFSLVGHAGGSILYSRFKTKILSESSLGEEGAVVFIINSGAKNTTAMPTLDYFGGLKYETCLSSCLISLHVGWEERVFFNMNQIAVANGNLALQGLTIGAHVNF